MKNCKKFSSIFVLMFMLKGAFSQTVNHIDKSDKYYARTGIEASSSIPAEYLNAIGKDYSFIYLEKENLDASKIKISCSDKEIIAEAVRHDALNTTTLNIINNSDKEKKVLFSGVSGKFDVFEISEKPYRKWIGQADLAKTMNLPANSVRVLCKNEKNKLPNITRIDTIAVLKNSESNVIELKGINDGGEGNQVLSLKVEELQSGKNILDTLKVSYTSPDSIGRLFIVPKADTIGNTTLLFSLKDDANDSYNEKQLEVPLLIIPYINKAPYFDSIPDQYYPNSSINTHQYLTIGEVSDGNKGIQNIVLNAVSSDTNILNVSATSSNQIKVTPKAEGTGIITLTLKDDGNTFLGGKNCKSQSFEVVVGNGIFGYKQNEASCSIYPNPAKNIISLFNPGYIYDTAAFIDSKGKTILSKQLRDEYILINTSAFPRAEYKVKLSNDYESKVIKLILQ